MKQFYYILVCITAMTFTFSCSSDSELDKAIKQYKKDVQAIDDYLSANEIDVIKDPSGIRVEIIELGNGLFTPTPSQSVSITYEGRLFSNGTVFDEGTEVFKPSELIQGMKKAVEILPIGTKARVYIPSGLAYGTSAVNLIPKNSILVFDVELLQIVYTSTEISQFNSDVEDIDDYLEENSIEVSSHPSGIRFVITEIGAGDVPTWYDKIDVTYSGKLLSDSTEFFSGRVAPTSDFHSRVVDFLPGLQATFINLPEGSKATIYVPSRLAFGSQGAGPNDEVPPNSIVIFEIESLEIVD